MGDISTIYWQKNCLDVNHETYHLSGPGAVPWDPVNWPSMAALVGICYVISIEIIFRVLYSREMRKLRGLYFWSLLATALGCMVHVTGSILKFFVPAIPWTTSSIMISVGWWFMIGGQQLVLYSRIYLVANSKALIWAIRAMIAVACLTLFPATTATMVMTNLTNGTDAQINSTFFIIERLQLCVFLASETSLSIVYIWTTWRVLSMPMNSVVRAQRVVKFLVVTNALIIAMDLMILTMQFLNWYALQATFKPAIYAIKLKLEFAFLNQLFYITKQGFSFIRNPKRKQYRGAIADPTGDSAKPKELSSPNSPGMKSRDSKSSDTGVFPVANHWQGTNEYSSSHNDSKSDHHHHHHIHRTHSGPSSPPFPGTIRHRGDEEWLEGEPSVVTHVEAQPLQEHGPFAALERRTSVELANQVDDPRRRAEVGLHDFGVADGIHV